MNVSPLLELAASWRSEADLFRRRGQETSALLAESYATDLEGRIREWELEELTLEVAAEEAGMKYDTLQRKVASGELENAGRKGAPRVRRRDLFPGGDPAAGPRLVTDRGDPDLAEEILRRRG